MLNFAEFLLGTYLLIICIQEFFEYVTLLKSFFFSCVLDLPDWHKLDLISNDFKCSVFSCNFHKRGKPLSRHLRPISSLHSFQPFFLHPNLHIHLFKHSAHQSILLNSANWTKAGILGLEAVNQQECHQIFCGPSFKDNPIELAEWQSRSMLSSKITQSDSLKNFKWKQKTNLQTKVNTSARSCRQVRASSLGPYIT